jgi:alpha-beta hydrolase superfamily lysophospholipase
LANAFTGESELTLILIHGSSGSSTSLHLLARVLSAEGVFVYAPDIRGHGNTGRKGDIDYSEQLDDDFRTLLAEVKARQPRSRLVLSGFSAGGAIRLSKKKSLPTPGELLELGIDVGKPRLQST